ncbi:MAG: hypothetical protein IJC62_05740, partial [Clostridia bacterium]|nr:hypothetical protein [Clostridia bacterium]
PEESPAADDIDPAEVAKTPTKKKRSRFSLFLMIWSGVLAAVAVFALIFVYNVLADYEKHLPQNVAEDYAASITVDRVNAELKKMYGDLGSDLFEVKIPAVDYNDLTVVRNIILSASDAPVYSVYVGGDCLLDITLAKNGKSRFDFDRYYVKSVTWKEDFFDFSLKEYKVVAPADAIVIVNGAPATEFVTDENTVYPFFGKYDDQDFIRCVTYTFELPCIGSEPACNLLLEGILDMRMLECKSEGLITVFKFPEEMKKTVEITAPVGAEVKFDGILLTDGEAVQYPNLNKFDAAAADVPMLMKYTVSGLFDNPDVTATLNKKELVSNGEYFFDYPEDERYSVVLTVPSGAVCTVNGIALGESELVGITDHIRADAVHAFWGVTLQNTVKYEKYVVTGLIREPVVYTDYEKAVMPEALRTALDSFIHKYVDYVSKGYYNTRNNLDRVLLCLVPYTDTYAMMVNSIYAIEWNTPYTSVVFNKLETTKADKVADNCYYCEVEYDITMSVSTVTNEFKGTYKLVFTQVNGAWLLFSFDQ